MKRLGLVLVFAFPLALLASGYLLAVDAPDDRQVVVGAAALAFFEVGIVAALATLFAAFSSPFLTALFTFGAFIVGRSADTLSHLPARVFGGAIKSLATYLSKIVPNLMVYAPPRTLLTGEAAQVALGSYVALAAAQAFGWTVLLLAAATLIFRRRDFL